MRPRPYPAKKLVIEAFKRSTEAFLAHAQDYEAAENKELSDNAREMAERLRQTARRHKSVIQMHEFMLCTRQGMRKYTENFRAVWKSNNREKDALFFNSGGRMGNGCRLDRHVRRTVTQTNSQNP